MTTGFELEGVRVRAGRTDVLAGIDAVFPEGAWTALIGPSGSGKTTLLRLLNRLTEPSAGEVRWRGRPLPELDVRALRREVGLVAQQPRLSAGTVEDNLKLPVALGSVSAAQADERLAGAIARAGIDPKLLGRDIADLSGGERQRVALARTLLLAPSALLLDEPSAALDPRSARALMQSLDTLRREAQTTLVVVTHRLAEAREHADHVLVLDQGRVVEAGPARLVLEAPASMVTKLLLEEGDSDAPAD